MKCDHSGLKFSGQNYKKICTIEASAKFFVDKWSCKVCFHFEGKYGFKFFIIIWKRTIMKHMGPVILLQYDSGQDAKIY